MKKTLYLFDSSKGKKIEFVPIKRGEVSVYVCGPTVYDHAHLGHARSAIVFDILRRFLESEGYRVCFVKNFTDIDDKIIKKSYESGDTISEITHRYIDSYLNDMDALGVKRADIEPKATESLNEIFDMIQFLIQKGFAYQTSHGDVYFSVNQDSKYGDISHFHENPKDLLGRIENDEEKKDPRDFALWKSYKGKTDIGYESPFGRGRPGWHIECSAMIEKYFEATQDYSIDIHAGGSDLLFPHHENEAAQTRCAMNREIAKYWIHNGFVTINGEKMAKSLGNSFFVRDALKEYSGEVLRFYLLATHYRASLSFSTEDLLMTKKRLDRIYRLKKRIAGTQTTSQTTSFFSHFQESFKNALRDDLNISVALSVIDDFIATSNEKLDTNPKDRSLKSDILYAITEITSLLGVGDRDSIEYFQQGVNEETKKEIQNKIAQRTEAKKNKDYEKADCIRQELQTLGIALLDTPQGTLWEKI
ncbi:cysteine--tRNA ligase [Helicobacter monodelphidis]|uniref:cysteine--tRNA ligase n=1 Tax=Helicobacter sp. 15-1451 TaxID=2004995 RepID=UPI000DCCA4CC|nr:cysteine--tRNA ligase [Helicobacter sp. 15-1451]RAX57681.1 cysteine--tRNA ligase [Helicobacter sp. 15-1451]